MLLGCICGEKKKSQLDRVIAELNERQPSSEPLTLREISPADSDTSFPLVFVYINHFLRADDSRSLDWLSDYVQKHPETRFIDPPENIRLTAVRVECFAAMQSAFGSDCRGQGWEVRGAPAFLLSSAEDVAKFTQSTECVFPLVLKPPRDDGREGSHEMRVVGAISALSCCELPFVAQRLIPHEQLLSKIYAIGEDVLVDSRPSLPKHIPEAEGGGVAVFGRVSDTSSLMEKMSSGEMAAMPKGGSSLPPGMAEEVAGRIRERMGLQLFGIDLVRETGTDIWWAIDLNHWPGYARWPNMAGSFAKLIQRR